MMSTLTFLVAMATAAVAMDIPITRHWSGGFQSDFCYTAHSRLHGWTAHIVFERALDSLEVRQGAGFSLAYCLASLDRLVGLVVKASASRAEDPGFESR